MKLLMINPNTSVDLSARLLRTAELIAGPGTTIDVLTGKRGVPYIASRAEAVIGANVLLELLAEHHEAYDGAIVGAFGDPGLIAARELFDLPVVGMAESGMLLACAQGSTFGLMTFSEELVPWFEECVRLNRMEQRCGGIHVVPGLGFPLQLDDPDVMRKICASAEEFVQRARIDAIVLGGAPLAGVATTIRDRVGVPVVDCVQASVRQIETIITLGYVKPLHGAYRRRPTKPTTGLPPALAARFSS